MQECREALEPAILFKNCSHITVSGRGIIDGRGTMNGNKDREDAAISPHQGGVMLIHSNNITFNDTYVRDTKQWNWECHTVENIYYNNIKGMSPYSRPWIDGLNITSGKNVYVNGAFTMGNDDCFASGHYNPSDEFPRRIFSQNLTEYINDHNVMAAAYYYNRDRLKWDTKDSENINLKNTLHFSLFANGIRTGANTRIGNETANSNRGRKLKSYFFDNVHSVNSGSGQIRFQIESMNSYPDYESIVIKNSSFWGTDPNMAQLPPGRSPYNPKVANVIFENVWFNSTYPMMKFDGIKRITLSNLHFAGILLENTSQTPGINITDACDNVEFTANGKSLHYSYKSDNK